METKIAVESLSALGHEPRLEVFKMLIDAEPGGMKPTAMLEKLNRSTPNAKLPASSLSSHLSVLKKAHLITSDRISREILYRANMPHVQDLLLFLVADCCRGQRDVYEPMIAKLFSKPLP